MELIDLAVYVLILGASALVLYVATTTRKTTPEDIICPVCGYYCLGKGGIGCIDKPGFQLAATTTPKDQA